MNPRDAFERCLEALYEAALDDGLWPAASALIEEAVGTRGNVLTVGERSGDEVRVHFNRLLYRGEERHDLAREYFDVYSPSTRGRPASGRGPSANWSTSPSCTPKGSCGRRRRTTRDGSPARAGTG